MRSARSNPLLSCVVATILIFAATACSSSDPETGTSTSLPARLLKDAGPTDAAAPATDPDPAGDRTVNEPSDAEPAPALDPDSPAAPTSSVASSSEEQEPDEPSDSTTTSTTAPTPPPDVSAVPPDAPEETQAPDVSTAP